MRPPAPPGSGCAQSLGQDTAVAEAWVFTLTSGWVVCISLVYLPLPAAFQAGTTLARVSQPLAPRAPGLCSVLLHVRNQRWKPQVRPSSPRLLTLLQGRLGGCLSLGGDFPACFPRPTLPLSAVLRADPGGAPLPWTHAAGLGPSSASRLPRSTLWGRAGAFQQLYATLSESHDKQVQTLLLDFGNCCLRDRFAYKYPLFSLRLFPREAGKKNGIFASPESACPCCCCCSFLPELVLPVPASQALSVLRGAHAPKWD